MTSTFAPHAREIVTNIVDSATVALGFFQESALSRLPPESLSKVRLVIHVPNSGSLKDASAVSEELERFGILTTGIASYDATTGLDAGRLIYYVDDQEPVARAITEAVAARLSLRTSKSSHIRAADGLIDIWIPP
ncbi:MAG: hypothetical protein E5W19_30995 [Mesorhizobium sp.]|nr:MAG: hypothetical protein E5W19_30995 [Mesorhizobium sp.]